MTKLAVIATIKLAPEHRDTYLQALRAHAARCRVTEPGTLVFDILVPQDDAASVMLYEVYADEAAFQAHLTGESIKQVRRDAPDVKVSLSGIRCHPVA